MKRAIVISCLLFNFGLMGCQQNSNEERFSYSVDDTATITYSGEDQITGSGTDSVIIQLIAGSHYPSQGNSQILLLTPEFQISLVFLGAASGTYLLDGSSTFSGYYIFNNNSVSKMYGCSGYAQTLCVNAGSSITIDSYGNVGEYISGIFDVTLCDDSSGTDPSGMVCKNIKGLFNAIREPDA
uniref:Lipoprotein n=1 Tax=Candidatus Kentrum sp. LPFa TaxID=2126335 RepID=A0A450W6U2_9GAMM|nr:MAG: hypothetical protein BECKLPF1236B_GA0070989_10409 [Candidatus Kentron sp. LPFa]